jgi:predicted ArsR family transcriptional regulator
MLSNLINLLSKNETYLNSMIADKLGVGERMARQMLHELARLGYVENIVFPCCSGRCKNCTFRCNSANFAGNRSAVWMLTEKGRKAAGKI